MQKIITYSGKAAKVGCDEKCHKAWGVVARPKIQLSEDEDDVVHLADDELGAAPVDPGTYEGGDGKPVNLSSIPNKWCLRQCERCSWAKPNELHLPVKLKDWSLRRYNQPWKHFS